MPRYEQRRSRFAGAKPGSTCEAVPSRVRVCKAHRLLHHSTLGSRVIKKKKKSLAINATLTVTTSHVTHLRQSRPNSGFGSQAKGVKMFKVVASSLGRGTVHLLTLWAGTGRSGFAPKPGTARRQQLKRMSRLFAKNGSSRGQNLVVAVLDCAEFARQ